MIRTSLLKQTVYLSIAALMAGSLPAQDIALPPPQKSGGLPLMDALAKRATTKAFDSRDLSPRQLSNLLWASFGINRPDGKRTAPSAHDHRATDIYVLLKNGAYLYEAGAHKLNLVHAEDIRKSGATQEFATNAPVTLILVADLARMGNDSGEVKTNMAQINVGYISQNAYLYCASEGLATGARVSMDRKTLDLRLKLRPSQMILLAQSVGHPKP